MTSKIKDVRPIGSQIMVELLSAQEAIGTKLVISGSSTEVGAPQGYILGHGPRFDPNDWGFGVGDRVLLQGKHVPLPKLDEWKRERSLMDPNMVKAVLLEEEEEVAVEATKCCGGSESCCEH